MSKNIIEIENFYNTCTIENNVLNTHKLYSKSKSGSIRVWQAHIICTDSAGSETGWLNSVIKKEINFNTKENSAYYTSYGIINKKITISAPTLITSGKNIGQKNETTPFQQALSEIRSEFINKTNSGAVLSVEEIKDVIYFDELANVEVNVMLLHDVSKHWNKVKYPCCIQPKLDGLHLIAVYKEGIKIYSRGMTKKISQNHIRNAVEPTLKKYPGLYLTGEIYKEGINRQEITSQASKEKDEDITTRLNFYVFDLFVIPVKDNEETKKQSMYGFINRYKLARKIVKEINSPYIILVDTKKANNRKDIDEYYKECTNKGYEGIVIRKPNSLYEYGITKEIRSYNVMKYKIRKDSEFEIVNYKEGKGKYKGCIIFEAKCQNLDCTFWVEPNWTIAQRKEAFLKGWEYIGKFATISYDTISNEGVPIQPKLIAFKI